MSETSTQGRWARTTLGHILPLTYGKAKTADAGYSRPNTACFGSGGMFGVVERALTRGPTLIVGRKGAAGGVHYSADPCWPTDTAYFTEGGPGTHLPLFRYLLESLRLSDLDRSTAIPSLSRDDYNRIEVVFPESLEQQAAIVAHLEGQFSRLDAGITALKRAQAKLKRYRASVLRAACEGRLVPTEAELARKEGRDFETGDHLLARILEERRRSWSGKGKYREPQLPGTTESRHLPIGWALCTVEQVNDVARPCAYGVLQPGPDLAVGIPIVRVGDIENGRIKFSELKRISPEIAAKYPRTKLLGGEIAITLVGAIGRTAIVPPTLAGGNTARAVGIIPLVPEVNGAWIELWFRNPEQVQLMTAKSHEVARKTLNLEDVRAALVALPPLTEQERIVTEIERRLSVSDQLERTIASNLFRATRLRQSILQDAFSPGAAL